MEKIDALVVGAGVVGLAVARSLSSHLKDVVLIERHSSFGEEISSRNSEVIHAGIYYPEHSLKAKLCVKGKVLLYDYLNKRRVSHKQIGKLIVATTNAELKELEKISLQAKRNGVDDLKFLDQAATLTLEPELEVQGALLSPSTGILNVHEYMQALLSDFCNNGGIYVPKTTFVKAEKVGSNFKVDTKFENKPYSINAKIVVNCGGLGSVSVANKISNLPMDCIPKLRYCKGHYFTYSVPSPFKKLIYPIPQKAGLGIHSTIDLGGQLRFGPDTEYINEIDYSVNSELRYKFLEAIKSYYPNVNLDKLQPGYAGIRPKLQGQNEQFRDFIIQSETEHGVEGLINFFGIESPGVTASLALAEHANDLLGLTS